MNQPMSLISEFLLRNAGRPVVAVQGQGFVGSVMALVCANALEADYAVVGVELPTPQGLGRVAAINSRKLHISASDPKVQQFFLQAHRQGNLYATCDAAAFAHADFILVDINLDVVKRSSADGALQDFDVDLAPFEQGIRTIGQHCKEDVVVIVETTVPPGTCQHVVYPALKQELRKRGLRTDRVRLGHSYERVMPGPNYVDSIQNFYRVYSGVDEASADATEHFLRTIIRTDEYPLTRLKNTTATEMAKVLENAYRSMNIAFMVEWSRFAEEAGVDLYAVVKAIRMRNTHSNMMLPGIGVGGYCLTKDPLLASWARKKLFGSAEGLVQSEQGVQINDRMPYFAFEFLRERYRRKPLSQANVLLLGAAYRGDVADTRFSPVEPFYRLLKASGAQVTVHDYYLDYWAECGIEVCRDLARALDRETDIVALCTGHTAYMQDDSVDEMLNYPTRLFILDSIGMLSEPQLSRLREHHEVKVIGRGDLQ